jgi:starch phosphorylase
VNNVQLYSVSSRLPEKLQFLETLASNLWWSWNPDAVGLFRRVNPELWRESGYNPVSFLNRVRQEDLEVASEDEGFLGHQREVQERFEAEVLRPRENGVLAASGNRIAYFSLEYGLHESLRLYAGGLGVLAGDHLKSASDLGLPMAAVGLLYRQGYIQQYLSSEGWQQEGYPVSDIHSLPMKRLEDSNNRPVLVTLPLPEGPLQAVIWRMEVGRVPLYLLDTDISENPGEFRHITDRLYGGDRRTRLRQEILLGIGGFRALLAAGYEPEVCHMNEGHAAFVGLARIAHLVRSRGVDVDAAREISIRSNVFTTHTPVPAGNEAFPVDLLRPHLEVLKADLGLDPERILAWGRPPGEPSAPELSMTILALRMARYRNGVSELHGRVARRMWAHLYPRCPLEEVPIEHVTNGVHAQSWISQEHARIYRRYLGSGWWNRPAHTVTLARVAQIPDEELWQAHELARSRLIHMTRDHLERQLRVRNAPSAEIAQARSVLQPGVLTIGFAKRFAAYKRGTLLLRDSARFEAMLTHKDRPVQVLFAGNAHPADEEAKRLIQQLFRFVRNAKVRHHVVLLENYDIRLARHLVQGADVWLNAPRRPLEASGTSGMKAALNGTLNVSTLDGWWQEAYDPMHGWAIGRGEEYADPEYGDATEAHALYNLLEEEVIPCFYDRSEGSIPRKWIKMMKGSIEMGMEKFTSQRMVQAYAARFYRPASEAFARLCAGEAAGARRLVGERKRFRQLQDKVRIEAPRADRDIASLHVGDRFGVTAVVHLGELRPEEVDVQIYYGAVDAQGRVAEGRSVASMAFAESQGNGTHRYRQEIVCEKAGRYGFTARVLPHGADWTGTIPGFVVWA